MVCYAAKQNSGYDSQFEFHFQMFFCFSSESSTKTLPKQHSILNHYSMSEDYLYNMLHTLSWTQYQVNEIA